MRHLLLILQLGIGLALLFGFGALMVAGANMDATQRPGSPFDFPAIDGGVMPGLP